MQSYRQKVWPKHHLMLCLYQVIIFLVLCLSLMTFAAKYIQLRLSKKNFLYLSKVKSRIINEVPTLLMMLVIAMVIFRPKYEHLFH